MTAATITRDVAREQARERLPEILADVVPGFRPERAFTCLNPMHEDRHPSMRLMPRSNTARCFSCGAVYDVFDVVGVVHGLTGGDAFRKTYEMLGIETRGGFARTTRPTPRRTAPPPPAGCSPEELAAFLLPIIYPPGWDAPEPAVTLPEAMQTVAKAEAGLMGILARHPQDAAICREFGLKARHFDDWEFGLFFEDMKAGVAVIHSGLKFYEWLREQAAPRHMLRKLSRLIIENGQRRLLAGVFAHMQSHRANDEDPVDVMAELLNRSSLVTGECYTFPDGDDAHLKECLDAMFERFHNNDDVRAILGGYRFRGDGMAHARN